MKKYESYQSSGNDWIREVPNHWKVTKLKFNGNLYSGLTGKSGEDFKQENSNLNKPFIPFTNIANNEIIDSKKLQNVIIRGDDNQNLVLKNDIFFMMSSENYDDVGKSTILLDDLGEVYLNSFCKGFRVTNNQIHAKFLNYQLLALPNRKRMMIEANGFTRINLKMEKVNDFVIFLPPLEEQTYIATFLDNKTTAIDQSIADKENLINLLAEEKKALINEAVTKGVVTSSGDEMQNVALKNSGVDWLGDIPAQWEVKKLKYLLQGVKGALKAGPFGSDLKTSDYQSEGNYKVYTQRHVLDNDFETGEDYISNDKFNELSVFEVKPFDILVTTRGSIGKATVVPQNIQNGIIHPCLIRLRIDNKKVLTNWLLIYFNESSYFKENVHLESNSTIIEVIYGYTLNNISIPIPPLAEQTQIVTYIETESQKIDEKVSLIKEEIALLKEYRGTLIFEAVTGKIDVRV